MSSIKSLPALILSVLFFSNNCLGHADHEKARYVSFDGTDIGKCDNPEKPCKTVSYAGLKSNKGDKILLSEGNYVVDDVDMLFEVIL